MKIRLKRPEEPELAALWDEAKRTLEERSTEIDDAARIVYAIQSVPAGERRMAAVALATKLFIEDRIPERT